MNNVSGVFPFANARTIAPFRTLPSDGWIGQVDSTTKQRYDGSETVVFTVTEGNTLPSITYNKQCIVSAVGISTTDAASVNRVYLVIGTGSVPKTMINIKVDIDPISESGFYVFPTPILIDSLTTLRVWVPDGTGSQTVVIYGDQA